MAQPEIYEQANALHNAGKYDEAEKLYDLLLAQNHDNPGLLATLGTLYSRTGKYGLAISMLQRAATKTPQSDILCNLACAYKFSGQIQKAYEYFKKATEHNPSAVVWANYAALFTHNGTPEKCLELTEKALKIDPNCEMAHWNRALSLLELGRWEEAWKAHEWGFKAKMRIDRAIVDIPVWDGTSGKRIWVYGEQGIGDEIMFASMLPDLIKENEVVLECHPRLVELFRHSFPEIKIYGTREDNVIYWPEDEKLDCRISIGSLGQFFRNKKEDFPGTPYIKANAVQSTDKFRVGISWTGGLKPGRIYTREVPLAWWKSILNNDCEFVSLQYTDCDDEIKETEKQGYSIKTYPEIREKAADYIETAKVVASCDLVISCCTSVIHLAGAMGIPTWVMVPNKPAWRYGVKGPMPWYRSVRLYRQPEGDKGAWMPVIQKVGFDLSELLQSKKRKAA